MAQAPETRCPVTEVATLLSDAWTMRIIYNLLKRKEMRFCELERELEGISTRTLTLKLKRLEREKILKHRDTGYAITAHGMRLKSVIRAMEHFGT
ncbi:MAG TPA: helix-turn-helix domain-containing protein [Verrucomicrobiae bacterium]|nr:helix-turn-helix domain-containing protein [Verrucomicrobiae bacterium]